MEASARAALQAAARHARLVFGRDYPEVERRWTETREVVGTLKTRLEGGGGAIYGTCLGDCFVPGAAGAVGAEKAMLAALPSCGAAPLWTERASELEEGWDTVAPAPRRPDSWAARSWPAISGTSAAT